MPPPTSSSGRDSPDANNDNNSQATSVTTEGEEHVRPTKMARVQTVVANPAASASSSSIHRSREELLPNVSQTLKKILSHHREFF
jgi:hypothetical protein